MSNMLTMFLNKNVLKTNLIQNKYYMEIPL